MSARARAAVGPPVVDEGGSGSLVGAVVATLAPSRDRLQSTLVLLAPMLLVLLIWETFRLPQPALATFIMLMIARGDAASTIGSALSVAMTVSLGALVAIAVLALSLSQPALRIPLMALSTFMTMFLVRATTLGPVAFVTGFFATFGITQADNLLGLALSTGEVTNTEGFGRPQIDFFPPEEALLHALLWLAAVGTIPALLLAASERLAGADPRRLLLDRFRARTDAAAAFCRGEPDAVRRLQSLGREGIGPLLDLMNQAERVHRTRALHAAHLALVRSLDRLVLLLVAWSMARDAAAPDDADAPFLAPVGAMADALGSRLQRRGWRRTETLPPAPADGAEDALGGALPSLAREIRTMLERLRAAETERTRALRSDAPVERTRKKLLQPHAFGAPNVQFALKVTLAVMVAYLIGVGLDWTALGSLTTCFFVALGTIGETIHKMTLRIVGCLIGAALALGTILLLMPVMTGAAQLLLVFGAVAFASIWISFGSPRIAYAGWQLLLAFGLATLQGYGPTLDMETARDHVVGILVGNVVTSLVFLFVWPVSVGDAVRRDAAAALDALGGMMALEGGTAAPGARRATEARLRGDFVAAVTRIGGVIPNDRYEPARPAGEASGRLDRDALGRLSRLIVPVSAIATDELTAGPGDDGDGDRAAIPETLRDEMAGFHVAMRDWFGAASGWVRTGQAADRLRATLPAPPRSPDDERGDGRGDGRGGDAAMPQALARRCSGRFALYALLLRQVGDFLDHALPPVQEATGRVGIAGGARLVAG